MDVWWSKDNFMGFQSVSQVARLLGQRPLLSELPHWYYITHTLFLILLKTIFENFQTLHHVFVLTNIKVYMYIYVKLERFNFSVLPLGLFIDGVHDSG